MSPDDESVFELFEVVDPLRRHIEADGRILDADAHRRFRLLRLLHDVLRYTE